MRITINFKENREEEKALYEKLQSYSNTCSIIKEILLGRLPVDVLGLNEKEKPKFEYIDVRDLFKQ